MTRHELGSEDLQPPEPAEGTPLYLHLPFCAAKCHYCDFFSVPAEGQDVDALLDALLLEIAARAPRRPRTVFLGGGTPSLLSCSQLERLLDALDAATGFRCSAGEVTAECNPESLDLHKARCLLELGVNRISIGFQSLRDPTLELFGRVHTTRASFEAYAAARRAGADNVNVDLIYASPGQSLADWEEDLARVLALRPEHISAYNLTFEEDTLFRRWLERGRLARLDEELELEFLTRTRGWLADADLDAYEISNFSLSGRQCAHNVNYWHNGPYLGVGPSAVSKVGALRTGNVRSVGEYRRRWSQGASAQAWSETPPPTARLAETWWLGLRLSEGITPAEARLRADVDPAPGRPDPALEVARRLAAEGWLDVDAEDRYRLSARGLPVADAVAREFLRLSPEPTAVGAPTALGSPTSTP